MREDLNALSPQGARERVLEWCSRYGLPGVLLHQVRFVTLAPRWLPFQGGPLLVPGQERFVRTNSGWARELTYFQSKGLEYSLGRPDLKGTLVSDSFAPDAWARMGAVLQRLDSTEVLQESIRETWAKFFPGAPSAEAETYGYPCPLSDDFWRSYAEPYDSFTDALQCLSEALWCLQQHRPQMTGTERQQVLRGSALFEALLAPVSPSLAVSADAISQEWVCNSLLSAFAMMALQDLTENRRVARCESCRRLFISQHPAALFCSPQCRWKTQKRRHRQKNGAVGTTRSAPGRRRRSPKERHK